MFFAVIFSDLVPSQNKTRAGRGFCRIFSAADTPSSFPTGRTPFFLGVLAAVFCRFWPLWQAFCARLPCSLCYGRLWRFTRRFFGRRGARRFARFFAGGGFGGFIAFRASGSTSSICDTGISVSSCALFRAARTHPFHWYAGTEWSLRPHGTRPGIFL